MAPQPKYLTIAEAAAKLGVDRRTVYRWIESDGHPDFTADIVAGRLLLRESVVTRKAKQQ